MKKLLILAALLASTVTAAPSKMDTTYYVCDIQTGEPIRALHQYDAEAASSKIDYRSEYYSSEFSKDHKRCGIFSIKRKPKYNHTGTWTEKIYFFGGAIAEETAWKNGFITKDVKYHFMPDSIGFNFLGVLWHVYPYLYIDHASDVRHNGVKIRSVEYSTPKTGIDSSFEYYSNDVVRYEFRNGKSVGRHYDGSIHSFGTMNKKSGLVKMIMPNFGDTIKLELNSTTDAANISTSSFTFESTANGCKMYNYGVLTFSGEKDSKKCKEAVGAIIPARDEIK